MLPGLGLILFLLVAGGIFIGQTMIILIYSCGRNAPFWVLPYVTIFRNIILM
jgi:hypothetical protein